MPQRHGAPDHGASPRPLTLRQELADGSASPVVRTVASFALAALLAGLALISSYAVAEWVPDWSFRWNGYVRPRDELVFGMLALAGVAYLLCLSWIWTRGRCAVHEFWRAGLLTAAAGVVTALLCVAVDDNAVWRGAEEVLIGGLVCLAGSVVMLIWLQAGRRYVRRRATVTAADGAMDLRCPACGYRMVGLRESRCPECGTSYTLDELLVRQRFVSRGRIATASPPPPPVAIPAGRGNGSGASEFTPTPHQ